MPEVFNTLDTGLVRGLQPGGKLDVRNLPKIFTRDAETEPPEYFTEYALARMLRTVDRIGVWLSDQTRYAEEYSTSSEENAIGETSTSVVADYEPASEMITQVLVTGPTNSPFTLQLGDRNMSLATDATGKCLLSPVSFKLGPTAKRLITAGPTTTPGTPVNGTGAIVAATAGNATLPGAGQGLTGFDVSLSTVGTAAMTVTVTNVPNGPLTYNLPAGASLLSIRYPNPLSTAFTPTVSWTATAAAVGNVDVYGLSVPVVATAAANWFLHLSGHALTGRRTA